MARNRTPLEKAEISGRTERDPQRYRDRTKITGLRPLGDPYKTMTEAQVQAWEELRTNLPWLKASDRQIVRMTCVQIAKLDGNELSITGMRLLTGLLSKLGATPVDQCRVFYKPAEEDPDEEFYKVH